MNASTSEQQQAGNGGEQLQSPPQLKQEQSVDELDSLADTGDDKPLDTKSPGDTQPSQQAQPHAHHHHHHHHHGSRRPSNATSKHLHIHRGGHIVQVHGHPHHNHHHHHHHHRRHQAIGSKKNTISKRQNKVQLDKLPILEILSTYFPERKFLGGLIYNSTTSWSNIQLKSLIGLKPQYLNRLEEIKQNFLDRVKEEGQNLTIKYILVIPPLNNEYINHLIEVRIPYRYIKIFREQFEEVHQVKRQLWGGGSGIYLDDLDLLAVLAHQGLFDNNINLSEWNAAWQQNDLIIPTNLVYDEELKIYNGDLNVSILLLPGLPNYKGYTQNGINSRSWMPSNKNQIHSRLSYCVFDTKWEQSGSYLKDYKYRHLVEEELQNDLKLIENNLLTEKGWQFNLDYYKKLKQKFDNLQPSKD